MQANGVPCTARAPFCFVVQAAMAWEPLLRDVDEHNRDIRQASCQGRKCQCRGNSASLK